MVYLVLAIAAVAACLTAAVAATGLATSLAVAVAFVGTSSRKHSILVQGGYTGSEIGCQMCCIYRQSGLLGNILPSVIGWIGRGRNAIHATLPLVSEAVGQCCACSTHVGMVCHGVCNISCTSSDVVHNVGSSLYAVACATRASQSASSYFV